MRSRYMREAGQIGQKLFLAVTDEEDALQWEKLKKVMKRWRALKKPDGITHGDDALIPQYLCCRPEFNEEYVELTLQLKALIAQMNQVRTAREKREIEDEIRTVKKKRCTVTTYTDRITGAAVIPKLSSKP